VSSRWNLTAVSLLESVGKAFHASIPGTAKNIALTLHAHVGDMHILADGAQLHGFGFC